MCAASADGSYFPPFILFKGACVQVRWVSDKAYPGTLYAASSNGWMEEPQFFEWFVNAFVPYLNRLRKTYGCPDQTALLVYDGHSSHISYRIIKCAMDNNVHLIKLPSHLTDKIQPLDVSDIGPLKTAWDKILVAGIFQLKYSS